MEHPWDSEIHICINEVPGVINGLALGGYNFIETKKENRKKCRKMSSHGPLKNFSI